MSALRSHLNLRALLDADVIVGSCVCACVRGCVGISASKSFSHILTYSHTHTPGRRARTALAAVFVAACFLLTPPGTAGAQLDLQDIPTPELVKQIAERASDGKWTGNRMREASRRGMTASIEASNYLDPDEMPRSARMLELIALAGRQRALPAEVLRLYDPVAHSVFYSPEGLARQTAAAIVLDWEAWPQFAPEACVRAAPAVALDWIRRELTAEKPRTDRLASLLRTWARWIAYGNERKFHDDVHRVAFECAGSPAVTDDVEAGLALLGLIGSVRADSTIDFVKRSAETGSQETRSAACRALGKLGGPTALSILTTAAEGESCAVRAAVAEALGGYPDSADAGALALRLFRSVDDLDLRREILLTAQDARWPQAAELVDAALATPDQGVLGAALGVVGDGFTAALKDRILELVLRAEKPWPTLVDALGEIRDNRAVPKLGQWLSAEPNTAMRIKMVLALEKIGGDDAAQLVLNVIATDADRSVVQQALRAAGEMDITASVPDMIELARDTTAPPDVRSEAVWALGRFRADEAGRALDDMSRQPGALFEAADSDPAELEMARLYVELARLRFGRADAGAFIETFYEKGTPSHRLTILVALGYLGVDHSLIKTGLASSDFPVVLGAVRAAHDVAPEKYAVQLREFRRNAFIEALLATRLQDVATLRHYLDNAIRKGGKS